MFVLEGGHPDGYAGPGGTVVGTYLHGLLDNAPVRRAVLSWAAARAGRTLPTTSGAPAGRSAGSGRGGGPGTDAGAAYDRLAEALRASLDLPLLYELIGIPEPA